MKTVFWNVISNPCGWEWAHCVWRASHHCSLCSHLDSSLDNHLGPGLQGDTWVYVRMSSKNIIPDGIFNRSIDKIIIFLHVILHITKNDLRKGVPGSAQDPTLGSFGSTWSCMLAYAVKILHSFGEQHHWYQTPVCAPAAIPCWPEYGSEGCTLSSSWLMVPEWWRGAMISIVEGAWTQGCSFVAVVCSGIS